LNRRPLTTPLTHIADVEMAVKKVFLNTEHPAFYMTGIKKLVSCYN